MRSARPRNDGRIQTHGLASGPQKIVVPDRSLHRTAGEECGVHARTRQLSGDVPADEAGRHHFRPQSQAGRRPLRRAGLNVNSAYFHNHGGHEVAQAFYAEAYRAAVDIISGEQYNFSAVMHADERNRGMSKAHGYDVCCCFSVISFSGC